MIHRRRKSNYYSNECVFFLSGAKPQILSAIMRTDVSMELFPTSITAHGVPSRKYVTAHDCVFDVFKVIRAELYLNYSYLHKFITCMHNDTVTVCGIFNF